MTDLPKSYDPQTVEDQLYTYWDSKGLFKASADSKKPPYCIVIPPPNVTGTLHMGHALVNTLQDILIRWKRMAGFEALWLPGTDHAGIATQTVVERHLIKTEGKRRKDYAREEFLEHVWEWKEENEGRIIGQLKKLGCSCDWSRQRFTMDKANNHSVRTMFKKMYDAGLIYRGDYLVNWDPVTQTALADDEVEYEERAGHLWHIRYPLSDGSGHLTVATTRPETMLGDTAVAVAPHDERYTSYVGKTIDLPLSDRKIPVITDHHVDPEFGTGAVKITPAHDPNDYEMGMRHDLPFITMMTPDGKINEQGGPFAGMSMAEGRQAVVKELESQGLLEKVEPHQNRVGISYRSKATIEPFMSKQWFVKMTEFKGPLRKAVEQNKVRILPNNWDATYFHWIDNLRDWCISRQLWWGHRIPIWYNVDDPEKMICHDGEGVPPEVEAHPEQWRQDEDVLDTWFSSALWPFATLGWPDKTPELDKFYPNSVLVTGHDILFFWVARMLMMGEYAMGELPFPDVFLHGLIYGKSYWRDNPEGGITYVSHDEQVEFDMGNPLPKEVKSKWEKMSKSKGNIIDPLEIIEQFGTDAMRMALCSCATQGRQIDLDRRRFEEFKNFANKVWNGARFVFMNLEATDELPALTSEQLNAGIDTSLLTLEDRWILNAANDAVAKVNRALDNYQFDQASSTAYDFFWKELCAYYLEISKPVLFGKSGDAALRTNKQRLLTIVLCQSLRLLHPMAPFITEELFQKLRDRFDGLEIRDGVDAFTAETIAALKTDACIIAPYPQAIRHDELDPQVIEQFELLSRVVYSVRNIRGEMQLAPSEKTDLFVVGGNNGSHKLVEEQQHILHALLRVNEIHFVDSEPKLGFASTGTTDGLQLVVPLPEHLVEKERARVEKEIEKLGKQAEKLRGQLSNEAFVSRAPEELVAKQRAQLEETEAQLEKLSAARG